MDLLLLHQMNMYNIIHQHIHHQTFHLLLNHHQPLQHVLHLRLQQNLHLQLQHVLHLQLQHVLHLQHNLHLRLQHVVQLRLQRVLHQQHQQQQRKHLLYIIVLVPIILHILTQRVVKSTLAADMEQR